ncbi:MAG: ATP-binding protein [Bacteroidales bacterium]|nr:ATP-binding protein [Bacteroidales bacterium]
MHNEIKRLPIGIQNFESLRRDGYLYVDKTAYVYELIDKGRYYFLSRPRRFGKSLLISTFKSYFEGKRELFDGLAIANKVTEWLSYPVLYMDLNTGNYVNSEALDKRLDETLSVWESQYATERKDLTFGMRFEKVIEAAYKKTGLRAVILVDEYDKPILQAIGNPELQDEYRCTLKGFYGALKSMDGYIKFALLTGVTKIGKVSVFSDLNNLNDISMDRPYCSICGITEQELHDNFQNYVPALAESNAIGMEECYHRLRQMYDGYHFRQNTEGVYNPFSLLNALSKGEFGSYWFETGTPSYLVELLQRYDYNLESMSKAEVTADVLNSIDSESTNPIPVIYQSGYLTIKGYKPEFKKYLLGFPNEEVEEGFINYLQPYYLSRANEKSVFDIEKFVEDVRKGQPEQFCRRLKSLFADTPYELVRNLENHYQNIVWVVFKLMGFYTQAEYHTSDGRIDLLITTNDYRYVMEFKLGGTAEAALQQIKDKQYAIPFAMDEKKTFLIGMNFENKTRNIDKYQIEPISWSSE